MKAAQAHVKRVQGLPGAALRPGAGLRRELGWLLALKGAALLLLWALCFSPAHRVHVDAVAAARHLALGGESPGATAAARRTSKE